MITKSDALKDFIENRYLGDEPLAWNTNIGACEYKHETNGGCAIGKFIPEDRYDPAMEGKSAAAIINEFKLYDLFKDPRSPFWNALQLTHDSLAVVLSFEEDGESGESIRRNWIDHFASNLQNTVSFCK